MKPSRKIQNPIHSLLCSLIVAGSVLAAPATFAYNRIDAIQALESVRTNWQGAEIDVWINNLKDNPDPGVLIGDSVRFSVESPVPSYFLVTLVDAKGETTLILGDSATQRMDFPPQGSEDLLEQAPPLGAQNVFVFASEKEFRLQELGVTTDERIVTLPKNLDSIQRMTAILNQHGDSVTLAMAPRYTYFVDDPTIVIGTRGLRKTMQKQMQEVREPTSTVVTTAQSQPKPQPTVVVQEPVQEVAMVDATSANASSALSLDIKFEFNSAILGDEGIAQLDVVGSELVTLLESDLLPVISLQGHTDDIGEADYNMSLSDQRAKTARAYLIDTFGLPAKNISADGMGESTPMVQNKDRNSRAINRRVELRVMR